VCRGAHAAARQELDMNSVCGTSKTLHVNIVVSVRRAGLGMRAPQDLSAQLTCDTAQGVTSVKVCCDVVPSGVQAICKV